VSDWVEYLLGFVVLFIVITLGIGLGRAGIAKANLTVIAQTAAAQMSTQGGYTESVQQTLIQSLQAGDFNPRLADVTVSPNGTRATYGAPLTITIAYPLPVQIVDYTPFTVALSASVSAVSMDVGAGSTSLDPLVDPPGAGTNDLQGHVAASVPAWSGG
jgi:Flp pilus assembly protein TadG